MTYPELEGLRPDEGQLEFIHQAKSVKQVKIMGTRHRENRHIFSGKKWGWIPFLGIAWVLGVLLFFEGENLKGALNRKRGFESSEKYSFERNQAEPTQSLNSMDSLGIEIRFLLRPVGLVRYPVTIPFGNFNHE